VIIAKAFVYVFCLEISASNVRNVLGTFNRVIGLDVPKRTCIIWRVLHAKAANVNYQRAKNSLFKTIKSYARLIIVSP
jgi:hypothetical protein